MQAWQVKGLPLVDDRQQDVNKLRDNNEEADSSHFNSLIVWDSNWHLERRLECKASGLQMRQPWFARREVIIYTQQETQSAELIRGKPPWRQTVKQC